MMTATQPASLADAVQWGHASSHQQQHLQNQQQDARGEAKLNRAERRKRAFAAAAARGKDQDSVSASKDSGVDARMPAEKIIATTEPLFIASLDERTSPSVGFAEVIAKRTRTLRKLWTKIQKYEEMDRAALNKDQIEALSRKPEVQWSLHELEDLSKHAVQFDMEGAARLQRIKQEVDRAHAAAVARVREEERLAAESRTVEAVRAVYALLTIVPGVRDVASQSASPLSDDEVGALDILRESFLAKAHPQNAADGELRDIVSHLEAGAEVPVDGNDMTYAFLKPLLNKLLYPPRIPSPSPSNNADEDPEAELLCAAKAADQYAEAREEVADVLLGQASSLHETAEEMREVAEVVHHQHHPLHHMHQDAAVGGYPQMDPHHPPLGMPAMEISPEKLVPPVMMMTPQGIQFGSLGVSADLPSHTEPDPHFSAVEETQQETTTVENDVTTALVEENGRAHLIVDDQTMTTVTTVTHTVSVSKVPEQVVQGVMHEQQHNQQMEEQPDFSRADGGSADHGSHPNRERLNRPSRRFRPNNNKNRSPNDGSRGNFYRQDSSPSRVGQGYGGSGHFQRDPDGESSWQTRSARHPRHNRPQQGNGNGDLQRGGFRQNEHSGGNGPHRGGYRGGGFRGGYRGGRGGSGPRGGGGPGKAYGGPSQQNAPAGINVGA